MLLRKLLPDLITSLIVEFNISILTQTALFQELALLAQNVFEGDARVGKDLQMVANQMPILAAGAGDESRAEVVGLFCDAM